MTAGLTVEQARARMLESLGPVRTEAVPLVEAVGRVLAEPVSAWRDQPPFDSSAMDGWAVRSTAAEGAEVVLRVAGESAAGRPYSGTVEDGQAVRIFTGAPVPSECGRVVPQELAARQGEGVTLGPLGSAPTHIRRRGVDFRAGQLLLRAGVRLDPWRAALAASAGFSEVQMGVRPLVAVLSTGEELVPLGAGSPEPHQIYDAVAPSLAARAEQWGARIERTVLCSDNREAIRRTVASLNADLIVTVGGASVGDYDLVKPALSELGLTIEVASVNMRPGKPTWFGRLADGRRVLGLPGNPASALVCAELFLGPLITAWQGGARAPRTSTARLVEPLPATGPREHWMRGSLITDADGVQRAAALPDQDSSLVTVLADAGCLIRRRSGAPALAAGDKVEILPLERF